MEPRGGGTTPVVVSFRRPYLPGYHATLDGKALTVDSLDGLMPAVTLPPGGHGKLVLWYRPRAVTWGAGLAASGLALAGALAYFGGRGGAGSNS